MHIPLDFRMATKQFDGRTALNGLSLTLRAGEIVALLGRRGSGKSTAIRLALGMLAPERGEVRVFGGLPGHRAARRQTGALLQGIELPDRIRVGEWLSLVRGYYADPLPVHEAADAAGLLPVINCTAGRLSSAQRKALLFALAICGRPRLLLLDKPLASLEPGLRERIAASMRALALGGAAILLSARSAEEIEGVATRVCLLTGGNLVAETTVPALRTAQPLRRVLCRTSTSIDALRGLPEALLVEPARDGRVCIETGTPELLVRRLFALDNHVAELQVLHANALDRLPTA